MGLIFAVLLGLCFGSFATALSWRIPRGIPWAWGGHDDFAARSRCTSCNAVLGARDLVPLFSWIIGRGKCRYCGAAIALRYPLTELLALTGVLGLYAVYGWSVTGVLAMIAVPFLAAMMVIDAEHMILPDRLNMILAALGAAFVASLIPGEGVIVVAGHIMAALLYGGLLWVTGFVISRLLKKDALGLGDVKFMAVAGLWLGLALMPYLFILSGLLGIVWGLGWRLVCKTALFPFGPALIAAFYVCLLVFGGGFDGIFLL